MPDFTSAEYQKQRSDAELVTVIQQGRGMMPAFSKQMNEQGVRALVGHIRRFAPPSP
jgi:hypothetical protein